MKKCLYPQNVLIIGNEGYTISCPLENANVNLEKIEHGLLNAWNSKKYNDFRYNLDSYLEDKTKICWQCNKLEKAGATSLRTEIPVLSETPDLKAIQFKLSNRCQLVCAHCGPNLSSSWAKTLGKEDLIKDADLSDAVIEELVDIIPSLNYIRFTGGEPWMDPTHWKIIKRLEKENKGCCELHYITNGLINKKNLELLKSWPKVKIFLSVDGYAETYEWFRRKAVWKDLVLSYGMLKEMPNVQIKINYSITPWTIESLDNCKSFFKEEFLTVPIMSPTYCSLGSLTKEDVQQLGLTIDQKYSNIIGSNPRPLRSLKSWALSWDMRWKTNNWAQELYPWLNKI